MASGLAQAQQQRELTKQKLAADAARLHTRVRAELDWRARLKREAPRLIAVGAASVLLISALIVVRSRLRRHKPEEPASEATLAGLAAELREIKKKVGKKEKSPIWQQVLLRGVTAAGSAGGTAAAKQLMRQQISGGREEAQTSGGH